MTHRPPWIKRNDPDKKCLVDTVKTERSDESTITIKAIQIYLIKAIVFIFICSCLFTMPVICVLNLFNINEHNNHFKSKIQHGYNTKVTSYSLWLFILVSSMKSGVAGVSVQCESAVIVCMISLLMEGFDRPKSSLLPCCIFFQLLNIFVLWSLPFLAILHGVRCEYISN